MIQLSQTLQRPLLHGVQLNMAIVSQTRELGMPRQKQVMLEKMFGADEDAEGVSFHSTCMLLLAFES